MLSIGSLFSGIGGLELGLEWAGLGPVCWQVEIDPGCRAVLASHWPDVTRFDDVRTVGRATLSRVDLICGGFPCQDVSSAGKRIGLGGARSGLWFEYRRVISELRPKWVVVENVASGAAAWVDAVSEGLGQLGYAVLPVPLAAAHVGAPHERARVFLVAADTHSESEPARAEHAEVARASTIAADAKRGVVRQQSGRRSGSRRQVARLVRVDGSQGHADADPMCTRRARAEPGASNTGQPQSAARGWRSPMPDVLRVVHGVSAGLDQRNARPRIQALGNAVVPQCAEVVGHVIRQLIGA